MNRPIECQDEVQLVQVCILLVLCHILQDCFYFSWLGDIASLSQSTPEQRWGEDGNGLAIARDLLLLRLQTSSSRVLMAPEHHSMSKQ